MHNLTKTLAAMSLLAPMTAHSLGIGEIKLHSALNQKLDAEVALSLTKDEELSDIKVTLAPPDKFDEAGITWSHFLSKLKFKPVLKANGAVVIKISSHEVVQEPFLDFLVEVSWPKGDLFKAFTVLVDPPVAYQQSVIDTSAVASAGTSSRTPPLPDKQVDVNDLVVDGQYGPTTRNDSLWKVAEKVNQHSDVSVEQMMMALYKANPRAFYKKNVNALMAGKKLTIPEKAEIIGLSKGQASTQFYRQMAVWEGKAVDGSELDVQVASNEKSANQLTLVPPTEEKVAHSGYLTANTADGQAVSAENQQLQERLAKLEKQFAIMQEMLAIKNEQLAALQNSQLSSDVSEAKVPGSEPGLVSGVDKVEPQINQQQPEESLVVVAPPPVAPVVSPEQSTVSQEVVKPVTEPSKPVVSQPVPAPSQSIIRRGQPVEQDSGFNYYYLGFGLFGVFAVAGLGWLLWQRRQAEEEMNENSMFAASSEIVLPDDDEDELAVPALEEMPSYDVGTVGESSFLSEFTPSDFGVFETDQAEIDPTAETDVYLAYGRYQQAEELMRQAISDHPDKDEYKLKLLEIFYASENEQAFEVFANELIAQGKSEDLNFWSKVSEMGAEIIPGSALFSSELRESKFEAVDVEVDDALTIAAEASESLAVDAADDDGSSSEVDESVRDEDRDNSDIDFDLSSFALADKDDGSEEVQNDQAESLDTLDFDLSSFEPIESESDSSDSAEAELSSDLDKFDFDFDNAELGIEKGAPESVDKSDTIDTVALGGDDISLDDFDFSADAPKESAEKSEPIETVAFNVDDTDDISLDDFEFSDEPAATDKPEVSESLAEASADFDFDFDFDEVPGAEQSADISEQDLEVSDLTDMDEFETKIDLAKAYIDMGDEAAAKDIAQEVIEKGSDAQKQEAQAVIDSLT